MAIMTGNLDTRDIELAAQGDREAFSRLVRLHMPLVERVAGAIVTDPSAVSDIAQDTFLKAYGSLPSLRETGKFRAWLAGIARTASIDWLRARRREVNLSDLNADFDRADDAAPVATEEIPGDTRALILRAIESLPETYREILLLKYISGLRYEQMAEKTGLSVSAIESKLFRARVLLKDKLQSLGRFRDIR